MTGGAELLLTRYRKRVRRTGMRSSKRLTPTAVLLLAAVFVAGAATPAAHIRKTYDNVRFSYSTCYPADVLTP